MSAEQSVVIAAQGVNKIFNPGTDEEIIALQDINLDVESGEFISLIGPSGCGKSTLMRLVGDLLQPSSGELLVNGKSPRAARLDRDYGMVFQAATLYDWRSVTKNVQLPLEVMGYAKEERQKRAREMLEMVELSAFAEHYPWQLSGGMQQRVSIARALAFDPSILLMDEPFGALDAQTRTILQEEVQRLHREMHYTVLFITHSVEEAVYLGDRVVVMTRRPGRIKRVIDLPRDVAWKTGDIELAAEHPEFIEFRREIWGLVREEIVSI